MPWKPRAAADGRAISPCPGVRSLGAFSSNPNVVGDSLDHLIGTWTAEDAAEMDRALEDFSRIDEEMWR